MQMLFLLSVLWFLTALTMKAGVALGYYITTDTYLFVSITNYMHAGL